MDSQVASATRLSTVRAGACPAWAMCQRLPVASHSFSGGDDSRRASSEVVAQGDNGYAFRYLLISRPIFRKLALRRSRLLMSPW